MCGEGRRSGVAWMMGEEWSNWMMGGEEWSNR